MVQLLSSDFVLPESSFYTLVIFRLTDNVFSLPMRWKDIELFLILLASQISDSSLICLIIILIVYLSVFMIVLGFFIWMCPQLLEGHLLLSNSLSLLFGHNCFFLLSQVCPVNCVHWHCASSLVSFYSHHAHFTDLTVLGATFSLFLVNILIFTQFPMLKLTQQWWAFWPLLLPKDTESKTVMSFLKSSLNVQQVIYAYMDIYTHMYVYVHVFIIYNCANCNIGQMWLVTWEAIVKGLLEVK